MTSEECAVAKVYSHNASAFLLRRCFLVQHAHGITIWLADRWRALKLIPIQPWHSLCPIAPRHHCIGESRRTKVVSARSCPAAPRRDQFAVEHRLQPVARNVAVQRARKWRRSLSCRKPTCFRDCPGSAANPEKPAHHFLPDPISAKVPYQRGSRLILSALE